MKYLSTILAAFTFMGVIQINDNLDLVGRLERGTLQADVYDHQVEHEPTGKQIPSAYADHKTEVNMREMRMFRTQWNCAKNKVGCREADPKLQTAKEGR